MKQSTAVIWLLDLSLLRIYAAASKQQALFIPTRSLHETFPDSLRIESPPLRSDPALYWNLSCPFEQSMWSVAHFVQNQSLSPERGAASRDDLSRAIEARNLSQVARALEIATRAFERGTFARGRNLYLDGDSLTKQLFVSIGCLAWDSGLVEAKQIMYRPMVDPKTGKRLPIRNLPNLVTEGEGSYYSKAEFTFKGGGLVRYEQTTSSKLTLWTTACQKLAKNFPWHEMRATKHDTVVLGGTIHMNVRNRTRDNYRALFDCVKHARAAQKLSDWPRLVFMKTPLQHFAASPTGEWPKPLQPENTSGNNASSSLPPARSPPQKTLCVATLSSYSPSQVEDDATFANASDYFLGEHFDQRNLGNLHVAHGDCTHWAQPGVPDILAAELITYLQSNSSSSSRTLP
jgi:hypothetical protein